MPSPSLELNRPDGEPGAVVVGATILEDGVVGVGPVDAGDVGPVVDEPEHVVVVEYPDRNAPGLKRETRRFPLVNACVGSRVSVG
ncbi:hypothetical protein ACMD2_23234 [Ananas comosus]|uniref:Uncharacterized protein n=1 Tax=Ananas comosus TaxID=4615 RepID=A0A199VRS7_ANACO|nr:hypothetical protein ACMD2_23234 [Ananas comosus]